MAAGTMVQLAASVGGIDTSDNCTIIEAFGKAIILNGANKKVFDRARSKITTAAVGANPPDHDTVLTGGTSGAKMVVDYVTALTGACTIYGERTTTATFTNGETVTGLDDDGNSISFATTAEVAGPQWYNLAVYGGSSTYGSLPSKLYLGALFLGRLYLAGDPDNQAQWYASRQGNIFDFLYDQDDVQSACNGSDVEFGRLQDIIRTLVPCGNDMLLFGCHGSIYALLGDPMQGGSMKTLIRGVGIFSGKSWCFDEQGILYFWGTGGLYRLVPNGAAIEQLSEEALPRLVHDEALDSSTHRVTMEYDIKRHGVQIGITNLVTAANSCYWYEVRTEGFFPETVPVECSPYCMLYYDSPDSGDRDLLIGCADGYIRRPDETEENDDCGSTESAIDSYVTWGPFQLGEAMGEDGIIGNIYGILAGGATGGSGPDSNNVTYYVYVGDSPEEVIEKVAAGTYSLTGTLYGPGQQRGRKQRKTIRGKYGAVRVRNNTSGQTWGFEEIEVEVMPAGRLA